MRYTARLDRTAAVSRTLRLLHSIGTGVLTRALQDVGDQIVVEWQKNIDAGKSAWGKFAPLSPRYAKWKQRTVGTKPILELTGGMRSSFRASAKHLGKASYTVSITSVGSSGLGNRKVANFDKVKWAIEGSLGGSKRGHRPASLGEALGIRRKSRVGKRAAFSRPPRVFTAFQTRVIQKVLADALRRAAARSG